jgi:membrane-bound ClpP family serine protease
MSTMVALTVKADEFKLYQLLDKFSQQYKASYSMTRENGSFILRIKTYDFGELVRRLNLLKGSSFQIIEVVGSPSIRRAKAELTRTNIDALIGRETQAITDITPLDGGLVKLIGEQWFARPAYDRRIPQGATVQVIRVEGVSLIVEDVEEEEKE